MCVLALLDPLLCGAAEIVEGNHPLGWTGQIGDDEADPGIQLARMPLDLGNDPARGRPALRLVAEAGVGAANVLGRPPDRAAEQMADPLLQNGIGRQPDGVLEALRLKKRVNLRHGKGGIGAEVSPQPPVTVTGDDRHQHRLPVLGTVGVAPAQQAPFEIAELVEAE